MNDQDDFKDRRKRISLRQRKRINGTPERPRLRVFRSVSHIYAQVIDDLSGTTLASAASTEKALKDAQDARQQHRRRQGARQDDRRAADRQGHQAASCSIAAGSSITAGSRRWRKRRAKRGWSSDE